MCNNRVRSIHGYSTSGYVHTHIHTFTSLLGPLFPFVVCRYLAGGVKSGFKKVERDKYEPRLLHVKGRRNIRVQQCKLSWASMNYGDVFILDMGLTIWVWNGSKAGRMEKVKGLQAATRIRDEERGGRAKLEIIGKFI